VANEIYVDPNATSAAVIQVAGECYQRVGGVPVAPQVFTVDGEFDNCGGCEGQICVQSFLFSGIGDDCSSGGYVSSNMNLAYPIFAVMPTTSLPNYFPLQGLSLPCTGTPDAQPIAASSASSSPSLAVSFGGPGYVFLFPTTADANSGFTPGLYNSSYGPAATLTVAYPTSSPFPQSIPSSVVIGGGPVTAVRSPSTGLQIAVSSSSYAAWDETLPIALENLCAGEYYGFYGVVSDVSWDGFSVISFEIAPLQPVAVSVKVNTADGPTTVQFVQNSYEPTGTFTATDPLTVPQTLTVS
jgi:hypothetical protein